MTTLFQRIRPYFPELAGHLAILGITGPGAYIAFVNDEPRRWWIALLSLLFLSVNIINSHGGRGRTKLAPWVYLTVQTIIITSLLALSPNLSFYVIGFYILSIDATMSFTRKVGYGWMALFVVLTITMLWNTLDTIDAILTIPIYLGGFFFFATFAHVTLSAQQARLESQRLLDELRDAHRKLQEYALQAEQLGVSEERNRLAREMHDTIGHRLTVAAVQLEGAQRLIEHEPEKAENMVSTVRSQVREALGELRQTVATLRDPLEVDIPLSTALKRLAVEFEDATGINVHLLLPSEALAISKAHRLALFRTAQEALTNVQRHAQAREVWLQLANHGGMTTLRVSDNGVGVGEQGDETSFGIRGIRERASQLGGDFTLEPRPGGGLQICLRLPTAMEG